MNENQIKALIEYAKQELPPIQETESETVFVTAFFNDLGTFRTYFRKTLNSTPDYEFSFVWDLDLTVKENPEQIFIGMSREEVLKELGNAK